MDYEQIIQAIQDAPATQLPAILQKAIVAYRVREVFKEDGLLEFCEGADARARNVARMVNSQEGE